MSHLLQFQAIRTLVFILSLFPLALSSAIAKGVGNFFYYSVKKRRQIALENLEKAYGDTLSAHQKETIARKSFQNTALSLLELFLIKKIKKNAARHFVISGRENLEAALSQKKGVILITSHLGSWEYLGFLFYLTRIPCSVIVKNLKNPFLDKRIDDLRRETGVTPIPKKNAIRETLAELKKNHVVAVLIDQWGGREGIWIEFFGVSTSTTSLPVRLAKKTDCLLVPAYCLRKDTGQYEIKVLPYLSMSESEDASETGVTVKLNEMLEDNIRSHPEQWSWAHKRWKAKTGTYRQV